MSPEPSTASCILRRESATVYRLADGNRHLRFTNFRTSNGPDVHVYLVPAPNAPDNATVERAGFIELGKIKGNIGNQNYILGGDVDLSKYETDPPKYEDNEKTIAEPSMSIVFCETNELEEPVTMTDGSRK